MRPSRSRRSCNRRSRNRRSRNRRTHRGGDPNNGVAQLPAPPAPLLIQAPPAPLFLRQHANPLPNVLPPAHVNHPAGPIHFPQFPFNPMPQHVDMEVNQQANPFAGAPHPAGFPQFGVAPAGPAPPLPNIFAAPAVAPAVPQGFPQFGVQNPPQNHPNPPNVNMNDVMHDVARDYVGGKRRYRSRRTRRH